MDQASALRDIFKMSDFQSHNASTTAVCLNNAYSEQRLSLNTLSTRYQTSVAAVDVFTTSAYMTLTGLHNARIEAIKALRQRQTIVLLLV